jgi:excisionase family DNA binding protein
VAVPKPAVQPIAVRAATAAQMLDCSRAHIYQLIERGELRRLEVSGSKAIRVPIQDVYAVLGLEQPDASFSEMPAISLRDGEPIDGTERVVSTEVRGEA